MPRTVIPIIDPVLKVAATQAGLAAGDAYECQLTAATIVGNANFNEIPATGCAPAAQSPGASSWQLDLAWLQDWTAAGGGLSFYAFDNDTAEVWFSLAIDNVGFPTVVATGHGYVTSGAYGGVIGGPPAAATATWPLLDKPDIVVPAPVVAAAAGSSPAVPATASVNLHALATEVRAIPRSGMIAAAKAAKKIADDEGARAGGPLKGKKKRGLKLRARDDIRDTATGATCRIQGVSPAGWVWVTTGTDPHNIRRRRKGPMKKMTVHHPGTPGRGGWYRVIARVEDAVPQIFADTVHQVVG